MAQVPNVPLPSVAPSAAPTPLQNVNPPALAFGATAASESLGALGDSADKTSEILTQHANTFQALVNKQAADESFTNFIPQLNDAKTTFMEANKGSMGAVTKLPDLYTQVEQLRAAHTAGLSPVAAQEYNSQTRRYLAGEQNTLSTWAVAQKNAAIEKSTNSVIDLTSAQMAANPGDAKIQANGAEALGQQAAILAHQNNWTADDTKDFMQKVLGKVYVDQAQNAIAAGDLGAAQTIRDQHLGMMTADQLNTINRALGVKQMTSRADSDAIAVRTGGQPVADGSPRNVRNNNPLNLTVLGGDHQWTGQSGTDGRFAQFATPEAGWAAANANLEGYQTRHGINTIQGIVNRWAPASDNNNPNSYAATVAKATGIPVNQAVDLTDPGVRTKILTAMSGVEGQRYGGETPAHAAAPLGLPTLQPNQDPNEYLAKAEPAFQAYVEARYPGNPVQQQTSFNAMMTAAKQNAQVVNYAQRATYTQLATAVLDNNIQDEAGLTKAYPQAASDIANLPPNYRLALERDLKHNANEMTPARYQNIQGLIGLQHDSPQQFASTDLTKVDLPSANRLVWMKAQEATKNQLNKAQKVTAIQTVLGMPQTQSAMNGLGISKKEDPDTYYQFVGAIATELEHFQGKATPKDIQTIVANVTATTGQKKGLFGSTLGILGGSEGEPSFKVPQEEHDAIAAALEKRGLNSKDESRIASIYREKHRGR